MARCFRVTNVNGKRHLVNPHYVALVTEEDYGCAIGIVAPPADVRVPVTESLEAIEALWNGSKGRNEDGTS